MPFTPFHLGPALALGLPLRGVLHVPTFLVANVAVDVEPFLVLVLGLDYPLHGYLHTLAAAVPFGAALGTAMYALEGPLGPLHRALLLESGRPPPRSCLAAGALGTSLHVLLDSPLYSDIRPFFPLATNSLYSPRLAFDIYFLCAASGAVGLAYYAALAAAAAFRRPRPPS